jgi:hypothetical protein
VVVVVAVVVVLERLVEVVPMTQHHAIQTSSESVIQIIVSALL